MAALEILDDLFFIERGYLNGNHFVYRAKTPILIDTGYVADFEKTKRLITALGINLSDVDLIINTHSHCDHIGGNHLIQEASGCEIAMHTIGKYFSDTRDDWSTWWRYYNQEADFFKCTIALDEGDVIALGPHEFEVIYTPGHASDGMALYNKKEKILISSDALWERDIPVITMRVEGSRALFDVQNSLDKLKALDVNAVYPGHGPPFTDMKAAIAKSEQKLKIYLRNRDKLGLAALKKMVVYTLLMHKTLQEHTFFSHLMSTNWFKETIDFYFEGAYEVKYREVVNGLYQRGIIQRQAGQLYTTVRP